MAYSFNFTADDGVYTVEVDTAACYGYFEHNKLGDERGGELWFEAGPGCKLELIDYDGTACLPKRVADILRRAGYVVSPDFN